MKINRQPTGEVVHTERGRKLVKVINTGDVFIVVPFSMGWADKESGIIVESLEQAIERSKEMAN